MSYETIAQGLKDILRTIPDFSGTNITLADYKVLTGGNAQAIVLFPGQFKQDLQTMGGASDYFIQWDIQVELFVQYRTDPEVADKISRYRQAIIEKVNQYPYLGGVDGVLLATITQGDAPIPVFREDGSGPFYWLQVLICSIQEDQTITSLE